MPCQYPTRRRTARTHFVAFLLAIGLGTFVEPAYAQLSSGCTGIHGLKDDEKNAFYQQQVNNADFVWSSGETIRARWTNPTTDPTTAYLMAGASAGGGVAASVAQTTSAALTGAGATELSLTLSAARTFVKIELDAGNGNYAIECGLLQAITFDQPADQALGSDANLTATASSGLAVSFTSNTPAVCTIAGATVTPQSTGTCTITSTQAGNATYYAASDVAKSFAIKSAQTITFNQPADLTLGNNVDLTATASSGLAVSYTSGTGAVCTVAGNTVTSRSAGTCTITASQAGNANFYAAGSVAKSFAVTSPSPAPTPTPDSDGDGVADSAPDLCPNTPAEEKADSNGCSASQSLYKVTPSAGANCGIVPSETRQVYAAKVISFAITPATGFTTGSVGGTCGGTLSNNFYTTNSITADCTVIAECTEQPTIDKEAEVEVEPEAEVEVEVEPEAEEAVEPEAEVEVEVEPESEEAVEPEAEVEVEVDPEAEEAVEPEAEVQSSAPAQIPTLPFLGVVVLAGLLSVFGLKKLQAADLNGS